MFDHLIITRYNVPISWGRRRHLHKDEDWLLERQRLFEAYCLPSVSSARRGCPRVMWTILCAVDSPGMLKDFMADVAKRHPWIVPVYVEENSMLDEVVSEVFHRCVIDPRQFVLTTRLDSDDAIGRHFIKDLHRAAERILEREASTNRHLPALINFPLGYQIASKRAYISCDLGNPFLSFLEERDASRGIIGCYQHPHRDLNKLARTVNQLLASGPSWLQVLHGNNEASVVCGVRVPLSIGLNRFCIVDRLICYQGQIGAVKEAAGGIREQIVQSVDYFWNRRVIKKSRSVEVR